jgi:uncharacterized protein
MEIRQSDNGLKGAFFIEQEGVLAAEMTYVWAGTDRIIIDHTDVVRALAGKNAGKQMVLKAVEFAREKGISIVPLCPFAISVFDRVPEIRDVL